MKVHQVIPPFTVPNLPPEVFRLLRSTLSSKQNDHPYPDIQIADLAESFLDRAMKCFDFEDLSVTDQDFLLGLCSLFCQREQVEHWVCPKSSVGLNNSTFSLSPFGLSTTIRWEEVYLVRKTGEILLGTPYDLEEYLGESIFFNKGAKK